MATYKVIQDIEAEDKLIGWMTPRQTIYAAIVIISGFMGFLFITHNAWWLSLVLLPHMVLFSVLAGPFLHDQPSEVWLLAKIQFALKPRRRIWDQTGLKELVTITVPKKIERQLTDGLTQTEVKSRLSALANTIDSRGWAVKNVNVNLYAQPAYAVAGTDRLLDTSTMPQEVPSYEITAQDDILDERNNPVAQHLDQMITQSTQSHRQQLLQNMRDPQVQQQTMAKSQPADYWFLNATAGQQAPAQPGYATFDRNQTVAPGSATAPVPAVAGPSNDAQEALLDKIHEEKKRPNPTNSHLRTIKPMAEQKKEQAERKKHSKQHAPQRPTPSAAAQQLAQDNNLSVATIAKQAKRDNLSDGEVVISLR